MIAFRMEVVSLSLDCANRQITYVDCRIPAISCMPFQLLGGSCIQAKS